MPRHAPLDAHGVPHHIILRAIEGRLIFRHDIEKKRFVERMEEAFVDTRANPFTAIHPNPLRARMVQDLNDLGSSPSSRHCPLGGTLSYPWHTVRTCSVTSSPTIALRNYRSTLAHRLVETRRPFCYFAVLPRRFPAATVPVFLNVTPPGVGYTVDGGEGIAREKGH